MNISSTITTIRYQITELASRATLQEWLLYILIVLIPFSVRHAFVSAISFATGAYSDFTTYYIYLSDFVLIAYLVVSLLRIKNDSHETLKLPKIWFWSAMAFIGWLLINITVQYSEQWHFQLYFTVRIVILVIFAGLVAKQYVPREKIAWIFTILGAIQGIIGSLQFYFQKSLGLYIIGESPISPDIIGTAKIVAHGTKLIRGYGTFAHPNILGGFLVLTTLLNLYLLSKTSQKPRGILLHVTLLLNILGLCITFSRGATIAFIIGSIVYLLYFLVNKQFSRGTRILLPVLVSFAISILLLYPYLTTRASVTDNAVHQRGFYNDLGLDIIKNTPIWGLGQGISLFHMKQYANSPLEPYEIQPIHNIPILAWAELGTLGAILLGLLSLYPILLIIKTKLTIFSVILLALIVSYGTISLIDHYLYTIWVMMLLLWLLIGLALNVSRETLNNT